MTKLYRLNMNIAKTLNIGQFNPTCKAILKGMYKLEKENSESSSFNGLTGSDILDYCVNHKLWSTRQDPSKYHTTWAYYVKLLKEKAGVYESGSISGNVNEFLDEFLDPDDVPQEFEDDLQEDEEETLKRMIAEEEAEATNNYQAAAE